MAAYGWRKNRGVALGLVREGYLFSFVQAVRLLEALHPDRPEVGTESTIDEPFLRLRARVGFDFRASAVDRVTLPAHPGEPIELTANFMALAGIEAPLPTFVGERLLDRTFRGDTALRDFLDLFHHRLLSLWARALKKHRPVSHRGGPDATPQARILYSTFGLGQPSLRHRLEPPDRSLLLYSGLLAGPRRTLVGLERMLRHDLSAGHAAPADGRRRSRRNRAARGDGDEVPVEILPFRGAWIRLEADDTTLLGRRNHLLRSPVGAPARLSSRIGDAVLGTRAWRQDAGFTLRIGPVHVALFRGLLPGGSAHARLRDLVRLYAGDEPEVEIRLTLRAADVPPARLGRPSDPETARLGHCAWLRSTPHSARDGAVHFMLGGADRPPGTPHVD